MSTTIHRFAYKAVWDASDLSKGLMSSRALFLAQKKIVEESRTPFERLAIGQANLNTLVEKYPNLASKKLQLGIQLEKQYLREEAALRKLTSAEKARMKELNSLVPDTPDQRQDGSSSSKFKRAALVGAAAYAGKRIAGNVLGSSRDSVQRSERIEAGFRTFTRDAAKAGEMMEELRQKSRETGVSFSTLAGGVEQLLVARFAPDESLDTMARLAEVSGGNAERMSRLAIAMGQVRDMGRLQAEELGQLREAGWNPLGEIMKQTGMTAAQVKDQMRLGAISYDMVALALRGATEAGGQFNGRLDEIARTTDGAANRAAASMELAAERMGKAMGPALTAWEELKVGIAEQSADVISETKWIPSFFASIQSDITQWRDPAKAAGIMQKSWEQTRFSPDEASSYSNGADLLKSNKLDDQLAVHRKRLKEMEQAAKAAQEAESKQAAMQAAAQKAAQKAAYAPTEKGMGHLRDQHKAVVDLQRELTGQKDRQLTIEQKIFNLRQKMLADGANRGEIEKAAAMERQKAFLENRIDQKKKQEEKQEEKRAEIASRLNAVADRWSSAKKQKQDVAAMADLMLAQSRGVISAADFDRASHDLVKDERSSSLAPSMRVGSQEAYQFMAGTHDRQKTEAQEKRKIDALQQQVKLMQQMNGHLARLEPMEAAG